MNYSFIPQILPMDVLVHPDGGYRRSQNRNSTRYTGQQDKYKQGEWYYFRGLRIFSMKMFTLQKCQIYKLPATFNH